MKKLIPIAAITSFIIAGCAGGLVQSQIANGIENALPEYIGPAKKYSVRAYGHSASMIKGSIEHLHIEGTDVQVDPKLTINQLVVDMFDVKFNPSSREVKSVDKTTFEGTVNESSMNAYIRKAREGNDDLTVKLDPGKVGVQFVPNVAGVSVAITVTGKPVIAGGSKVNFEVDSASVAHLPIPSSAVNLALTKVNPILDLAEMKFPVLLQGIKVGKDAVVIKGNMQFKAKAKN